MWGIVAGMAANLASDVINKMMEGDKEQQVGQSWSQQNAAGNQSAQALAQFLPGLMQNASWSKAGLNGAAAEQMARQMQGTAGSVFGSTQRAANALQNLGGQMSSNVFAQNANASKIAGQGLGNLRTDAMQSLNNVGSSPASIAASLGKLGEGNMAGANNLFQSTTQAAQNALAGRSQNEAQASGIMDQGRASWFKNMIEPWQVNKENVAGLLGSLQNSQSAGQSGSRDSQMIAQGGYNTTQAGLGKMGSELMNTGMKSLFTT